MHILQARRRATAWSGVLRANEAVGKVPTTEKVYKLGYLNGLSIRDRRFNAKYGGRFLCKFFDLTFPTGSTLRVSRASLASAGLEPVVRVSRLVASSNPARDYNALQQQ
jgi:hypothetical protein